MKKIIKKKWIKALRSGKYKKTKTFLKCDGAFCALGVLVDCALIDGKTLRWRENSDGPSILQYLFKSELSQSLIVENWTCGVPDVILEKIGLTVDDEEYIFKLNDGGKKFTTIAKYIEEKF